MELTTAFLTVDSLISNGQQIFEQLRHTIENEIKAKYTQRIESLKQENARLKLQLLKESSISEDLRTILELRQNLEAEREKTRTLELKLKECSMTDLEEETKLQNMEEVRMAEPRMIPASFNQSSTPIGNSPLNQGPPIHFSSSQEANLESDEFRSFLKKRRFENDDSKDFKFIEVVRCKTHREKLPAHDCIDCQAFYSSLNSATHGSQTPLRNSVLDRGQEVMKYVGRHRGQHVPPKTPSSYWDLDFPDSPRTSSRQKSQTPPSGGQVDGK